MIVGVLFPVAVNHLIFPWYLSHWAMSRMGDAYATACQLLHHQYETLFAINHIHVDKHPGHAGPSTPHPTPVTSVIAPPASFSTPALASVATTLDPAVTSTATTFALWDRQAEAAHAGNAAADAGHADHGLAHVDPPSIKTSHTSADHVAGQVQTHLDHQTVVIHVAEEHAPSRSTANVTVVSRATGRKPQVQTSTKVMVPAPSAAPPIPTLAAVQAPLSEVLGVLMRDAALWQRGLMATPHAVHALVAAITLMADRLAALQVALQGASSLSPEFSSWSSTHLMYPLDPEVRKVFAGIMRLTATATELLAACGRPALRAEIATRMTQEIQHVVALRFQAHSWHLKLRQALHVKVLGMAISRSHLSLNRMSGLNTAAATSHTHTPHAVTPHAESPRTPSAGWQGWPEQQGGRQATQDTPLVYKKSRFGGSAETGASTPTAGAVDLPHAHIESPNGSAGPAVPVSPFESVQADAPEVAVALADGLDMDPLDHAPTAADLAPGPLQSALQSKKSDASNISSYITSLVDEGRSLSAFLPADEFHPSDTVAWLSTLYGLTHAMDAAVHVARVAALGSKCRAKA